MDAEKDEKTQPVNVREWIVSAEDAGGRLDKYLTAELTEFTRSHLSELIKRGAVSLNGKSVKAGQQVKVGDLIRVEWLPAEKLSLEPEDIPIEIVYQDQDLAVINKPQGMVVHPAPGAYSGTLVNALLYRLDHLSGINGVIRPGIVHRLDKDTSGLLVVAKNDAAHLSLQRQIAEKSAQRVYLALVNGVVKSDSGVVTEPIARSKKDRKKMAVARDGRAAETHFRVLQRFSSYTLVEFTLKTGRTHQIRVHSKFMGHIVVGDTVYGDRSGLYPNGQLLHAYQLSFDHPASGERRVFQAELPDYFKEILQKLKEKGD